jgi:hypothetical protein
MFETTKQKLYNNVFQLVFSLWIQPSLGKKNVSASAPVNHQQPPTGLI